MEAIRRANYEKVPTGRGGDYIVIDGFFYQLNRRLVGGRSFRCVDYKTCPARLHIMDDDVDAIVYGDHSHASQHGKVAMKKILNQGKEMAKNPYLRPAQIISQLEASRAHSVLAGGEVDSFNRLDSLSRNLRQVSQKHNHLEDLGNDIDAIVIPQHLATTLSGENFILADLRPESGRIIVLGSPSSLTLLSQCSLWSIHGIFKTCPQPFAQICSIHGCVNGKLSVPLIFAYLPNKQKITYDHLLDFILSRVTKEPDFIVTDYEIAAIKAVRSKFRTAKPRGCVFHLMQSIFRRVQKHPNLLRRFNSQDDDGKKVKLGIRCIGALVFLHPGEVTTAYFELRQLFPPNDEIREIFKYFDNNYLGDTWDTILFPISFWSCKDRFDSNQSRTNNSPEAWHNRVNFLNGREKPTLAKSLQNLKVGENHTKEELLKIRLGHTFSRKKKSVNLEVRLRNIMSQRNTYPTVIHFLENIATCISSFLH